jgi:rod shape-determining protein MreB
MLGFSRAATPDFALDLGTQNFLISNVQSVLVNDRSLAAIGGAQKLITGELAAQMHDRDPGHVQLIKPLAKGVISDLQGCALLLKNAFQKIRPRFRRMNLLVTAPLDITPYELKAFAEVAQEAGAGNITLVPEPVATAMGLIPRFFSQKGGLVVDVGAGITEVVLFSMGGLVDHASVRIGGDDFELAAIRFVQNEYQFRIGPMNARDLLRKMSMERNEIFLDPPEVCGHDTKSALPGRCLVDPVKLDGMLDPLFDRIVNCVHSIIADAPEALMEEISELGIFLSGGASQFPQLQEKLRERLGLVIHPDLQPLLGVARGEIQILQDPDLLRFVQNQNYYGRS